MPDDVKPPRGRPGQPGNVPTNAWRPGRSANPNGKVSLKNDLKRAHEMGLLPELRRVVSEWREAAAENLAELGAEGFCTAFLAAVDEAVRIDLPTTPENARAQWWRTTGTVAFSGPMGPKDSVWTYANGDVGNRLFGKPKEHVVIEDGASPPVDWSRVPEDRREAILEVILELQGYLDASEPAAPTEH